METGHYLVILLVCDQRPLAALDGLSQSRTKSSKPNTRGGFEREEESTVSDPRADTFCLYCKKWLRGHKGTFFCLYFHTS